MRIRVLKSKKNRRMSGRQLRASQYTGNAKELQEVLSEENKLPATKTTKGSAKKKKSE